MSRKFSKIICPKCGRQYLPGEIYLPKAFLGQPKEVVRDYRGHILDQTGGEMDLRETYICDGCDTKFSVRAQVQFYTDIKEDVNTRQLFRFRLNDSDSRLKLDES